MLQSKLSSIPAYSLLVEAAGRPGGRAAGGIEPSLTQPSLTGTGAELGNFKNATCVAR